MDKTKEFLRIFLAAKKYYDESGKRLAADGWKEHWQTLIATILSAQTRDDTTIPVAEALFKRYDSLERLSKAKFDDVKRIISRVNYNNTKAKNVIAAAEYLIKNHDGRVPDEIDALVGIPGVGRKTANLVVSEVHGKDGLTVDTHVHRISNVFGFVKTKTPEQTEYALMKVAPKKYWNQINRVFVLWGQDVRGYDKEKFLEKIK